MLAIAARDTYFMITPTTSAIDVRISMTFISTIMQIKA